MFHSQGVGVGGFQLLQAVLGVVRITVPRSPGAGSDGGLAWQALQGVAGGAASVPLLSSSATR